MDIVIDGSNLAHEGLSVPSFDQLISALNAIREQFPGADVMITVVHPTLRFRMSDSDRQRFDNEAASHGIVEGPPGRYFCNLMLLKTAAKRQAIVVSNSSFGDFQSEHPWLFDEGRLYRAVPVRNSWHITTRRPRRARRRTARRDEDSEENP